MTSLNNTGQSSGVRPSRQRVSGMLGRIRQALPIRRRTSSGRRQFHSLAGSRSPNIETAVPMAQVVIAPSISTPSVTADAVTSPYLQRPPMVILPEHVVGVNANSFSEDNAEAISSLQGQDGDAPSPREELGGQSAFARLRQAFGRLPRRNGENRGEIYLGSPSPTSEDSRHAVVGSASSGDGLGINSPLSLLTRGDLR